MLDLKNSFKNIRIMKTLLEHSILTDKIKDQIKNNENHIINLDSEDLDQNSGNPKNLKANRYDSIHFNKKNIEKKAQGNSED